MLQIKYFNIGEITLLEENPRLIKDKEFEKLCKSIKKHPTYFEARPLLCNPKLVVFAGNMRLRAAQEIGLEQVPVIVMDVSQEEQRELMILDNVQNGEWDIDMLSSSFDLHELQELGVQLGNFGGFGGGDNEKKEKHSADMKSKFEVVVEAKDEAEQEKIYNDLVAQGLTCRVLTY